jgi:hypothetical protein
VWGRGCVGVRFFLWASLFLSVCVLCRRLSVSVCLCCLRDWQHTSLIPVVTTEDLDEFNKHAENAAFIRARDVSGGKGRGSRREGVGDAERVEKRSRER